MLLTAPSSPSRKQLKSLGRRVRTLSGRIGLGPIGFDLGRAELRAVQIQHGDERAILKAAVSVKYPCPRHELFADRKNLKKFINNSLSLHGFRGNRIVTCTPSENFKLLSLEYPADDAMSEDEMILNILKQRIEEDLSDMVIDYIPVRDTGSSEHRKALVAVANLQKQIHYLELLRSAGLRVVGLEIGPIAIRRLVENISRAEQSPNTLVVNCGIEKSYLTVTSGRRLLLDRGINFGEKHLLEKLSTALEMEQRDALHLLYQYGMDATNTYIELFDGIINSQDIVGTLLEVITPLFHELVREIDKVVAYVHSQLHGADIQQIYLLGSIAQWPGADRYLNNLMNRPIRILNPFGSFHIDSNSQHALDSTALTGMALATGCALSELR